MTNFNQPTRRKVWPWVVGSLTIGFVFGVGIAGAAASSGTTAVAADRPATTKTITLPAPPPRTVTVEVTPEPEVPAGPAQTFGNGKYEVGVDVAPGKYKTAGIGDMCYYAFLDGSGSDADILDNNLGEGPQTVTLKAGTYFESNRCGTWQKVG